MHCRLSTLLLRTASSSCNILLVFGERMGHFEMFEGKITPGVELLRESLEMLLIHSPKVSVHKSCIKRVGTKNQFLKNVVADEKRDDFRKF